MFLIFRQVQIDLAERETRGICRRELLLAQEKAGESMTRLLKLNTPIRLAKLTRDGAILAMEAAAATWNAPAFTAAYKVYQGAIRSLEAMRAFQKGLIIKANLDLLAGLRDARRGLNANFDVQKKSSVHLQKLEAKVTSVSIPHVSVRPIDESDSYPEYELEDSFQEKQALQVSWKMHWKHPEKKETWTKQDWKFERTCVATLVPEKGSTDFKARLKEDRFSLKSSFFF